MYYIELVEGVVFVIYVLRKVFVLQRVKVVEELKWMVCQEELIEWVNLFFVVLKFIGVVILCIDLGDLNFVIKRFYYFMKIIDEVVSCF